MSPSEAETVSLLREFLVRPSTGLGDSLHPSDIDIVLAPADAPSDFRLFRATWGGSHRETGVSGVLEGRGPPELRLDYAIRLVFEHRLLAGPKVATPERLARDVAFLLDPMARHEAILTDEDVNRLYPPEWRKQVALPIAVEAGVQRGIVFCRIGAAGPTEVHILRAADGSIDVSEHPTAR